MYIVRKVTSSDFDLSVGTDTPVPANVRGKTREAIQKVIRWIVSNQVQLSFKVERFDVTSPGSVIIHFKPMRPQKVPYFHRLS